MIKYDGHSYKYYNENNEHEFIDNHTYDKAADIINELLTCEEFQCDSTIISALYVAMRKMQEDVDDIMIRASRKASLTKNDLFNTFQENGLVGVYNMGLKNMLDYLNGK